MAEKVKKDDVKKPLTKHGLVDQIAKKNSLTKAEALNVINYFCDGVREALKENGGVNIVEFVNFSVKERKERQGRNPKTGEAMTIKAAKLAHVKVSHKLHEVVQGGK